MTEHWRDFDPFFTSKAETYKSSSGAIVRVLHYPMALVMFTD